MKFWKIFRFELAYQVHRPWPWLIIVVLVVLSFLMTRDGSLSEVLYADFFLNSPFSVAKTTVFGSLIWLVMAAAIAGEAAAGDVATEDNVVEVETQGTSTAAKPASQRNKRQKRRQGHEVS